MEKYKIYRDGDTKMTFSPSDAITMFYTLSKQRGHEWANLGIGAEVFCNAYEGKYLHELISIAERTTTIQRGGRGLRGISCPFRFGEVAENKTLFACHKTITGRCRWSFSINDEETIFLFEVVRPSSIYLNGKTIFLFSGTHEGIKAWSDPYLCEARHWSVIWNFCKTLEDNTGIDILLPLDDRLTSKIYASVFKYQEECEKAGFATGSY